jgi:RNA polymerase sigma-70 factor (ECF subfamily)
MSNPDQFEAFMRDYQNMVFTTAYRLLADESESQDIAQEVFLKAYEHFDELRVSPSAGGWLKTVARNLCLNHLNRHRRRWRLFSELVRDEDDDSGYGEFEDQFPVAENACPSLETDDQKVRLEQALKRLPQAQRVPIVLFHIEEMSYETIAHSLGISLSKVKVDIHRGRQALRRILTQNPEYRMA